MKNYGDVVTMMGDFLHSVEEEKSMAKTAADAAAEAVVEKTAEAPTPGPNDNAKTEPEGKTSENVADTPAGQGAAGKEKQQDMEAGIAGVEADSPEATNNDGDGEEPTDDQGPKSLDASETVTENITVETTPEKVARAERLGNAILSRVADLQKNATEATPEATPEAKPKQEASILEKLASENPKMADHISQSYHDFATGWLEGFNQRQDDLQECMESGIFKSAAEADAMLDAVAAEDPGAIAPPGMEAPMGEAPMEEAPVEGGDLGMGAPEEGGEMDPETAAQLDQLADEMEAAGVSPEDLVQAAKQLEELTAAGVSPDEIIQAAGEVEGEGGGMGEAPLEEAPMAEEAPMEAAPEVLPEEAEKLAAERKEHIKDYIRGLQQD